MKRYYGYQFKQAVEELTYKIAKEFLVQIESIVWTDDISTAGTNQSCHNSNDKTVNDNFSPAPTYVGCGVPFMERSGGFLFYHRYAAPDHHTGE